MKRKVLEIGFLLIGHYGVWPIVEITEHKGSESVKYKKLLKAIKGKSWKSAFTHRTLSRLTHSGMYKNSLLYGPNFQHFHLPTSLEVIFS